MQDLSEALNGRGKTVDKLQVHLQELLIKLQVRKCVNYGFLLLFLGRRAGTR